MEYMTATQAARHTGISERTIRKWIKRGILPAQEVVFQGKRRWQIAANDLERVIEDRQVGHTGTFRLLPEPDDKFTPILERLEVIEHRLDALEASQTHEIAIPPPVSLPSRELRHAPESPSGGQKEALPDGWVSAVSFGKRHGIQREASITEAIRAGRVQAHEGIYQEGKAIAKYAFDPEQQRAFCIRLAEKGNLKQCGSDDCVCYAI